MATKVTIYPNLVDAASRLDPTGKIAKITEVLAEENPILSDGPVMECNQTEGHKYTIRTGLPQGTWRSLYQGVQPVKTQTAAVTEGTGNLEAYGEVDKDLADLNGNEAAFRFSEEKGVIQGMSNQMAREVFYGDVRKTPERFTGIAARLGDKKSEAGKHQIVDAGGTGSDLTSIYFITWGEDTCGFLFPKGAKAGLQVTDKGQVTVEAKDGSGNYEAYRTHYKWGIGMFLKDWRGVARVANIKVSDLLSNSGTLADGKLINLMIDAKNKIKSSYRSRTVIYAPTEVVSYLEKAAMKWSQNALDIKTAKDQFGASSQKPYFFEMPIKSCDAISLAEAQVK